MPKRKKGKGRQQQQQSKKNFDVIEPFSAVAVKTKKQPKQNAYPIPGLTNLGNTCFFNSVMQSLGQSHYFRSTLCQLVAKPDYSVTMQLPAREDKCRTFSVCEKLGELTKQLAGFLTDMQTGGRVLNPRGVFSEICKKAPRFSSYHQQDSQELLRQLLDALRMEEVNRIKRAILTSYNVNGKKEQIQKLTDTDRADIKVFGHQAFTERTLVDRVFGGVLTSTVVCLECQNESVIHESFLDLSLPVAEDKNMSSVWVTSPGGYQTRSRNKKKSSAPSTTPKQESEISKHQKKKKEKQAKKAARSANKKQRNMKERATSPLTDDEARDSDNTQDQEPETVSGDRTSDLPLALDKIPSSPESSNTQLVNEIPVLDKVVSSPEGSSTCPPAATQSQYAADGPTLETKLLAENIENLSIIEPADEIDVQTPPEQVASDAVDMDSIDHTKPVDMDNEDHTKPTPELDPNSLQASLKKFCTPELLKGDNKFACAVCTKKKSEGLSNEDTSCVDKENETSVSQKEHTDSNEATNLEQNNDGEITGVHEDKPSNNDQIIVAEDNSVATVDGDQDVENNEAIDPVQDQTDPAVNEDCPDDKVGASPSQSAEDDSDNGSAESVGGKDSDMSADNEESSSSEEVTPPPAVKQPVVFCEATKQILLKQLPPILTLHLKRFIQQGRRLQKNNKFVSFPTELDMQPYCGPGIESGSLLYSLYGIVEHSGGMQGGHYVAYVKSRPPPSSCSETTGATKSPPAGGHWFYISDSHVRMASEDEVLKSQAYILFYEQTPANIT